MVVMARLPRWADGLGQTGFPVRHRPVRHCLAPEMARWWPRTCIGR